MAGEVDAEAYWSDMIAEFKCGVFPASQPTYLFGCLRMRLPIIKVTHGKMIAPS